MLKSKDRLFNYLEAAAHLALIAAAAAAWIYWQSADPGRPRPASPTIHVDSSRVLSTWHAMEHRVLLFMDPTCPYCEQSMDFYARLGHTVDSMRQAGTPVAVAAVVNRSASRRLQRQTLQSSNVQVDTLLQTGSSFATVGISGVPTVAILDPNGRTRSSWAGLQDSTGEREILSAVRAVGTSP